MPLPLVINTTTTSLGRSGWQSGNHPPPPAQPHSPLSTPPASPLCARCSVSRVIISPTGLCGMASRKLFSLLFIYFCFRCHLGTACRGMLGSRGWHRTLGRHSPSVFGVQWRRVTSAALASGPLAREGVVGGRERPNS